MLKHFVFSIVSATAVGVVVNAQRLHLSPAIFSAKKDWTMLILVEILEERGRRACKSSAFCSQFTKTIPC